MIDAYYHKTLSFDWAGRALAFAVPADVFSTFQIDTGTLQLLKAIARSGSAWDRALDLGCGYGPIGVCLAASGQARAVVGIDRDAVAAAFAARNATANNLTNVTFRGGLAYADVAGESFDLIATNLPAKTGPAVHRLMLLGASRHLRPGGEVWAVVVRPLVEEIDGLLADPNVEVRDRILSNGYALYNYRFRGPVAVPDEPYRRTTMTYEIDGHLLKLDGYEGVPDFDSVWRGTDLVLQLLGRVARGRSFRRVAVYEPTQGHLPVILSKLWPEVAELTLASRDRLALFASAANLTANGFAGSVATLHAPDLSGAAGEVDLAIVQLYDGERTEIPVRRMADTRARFPGALVLATCHSSLAGRVETALGKQGVRTPDRINRKGFRAFSLGG